MNNFKRGLAVVLAAATAFTFAPVADIAAPAVAQADDATPVSTVKVTYSVNGATQTAKKPAELEAAKGTDGKVPENTAIEIDTVAHKTETIAVTGNTAAAGFSTDNSTIATVNPTTGVVTAVAKGTAHITVNVGADNYVIPVNVSDQGTDSVKAQVNGKDVDSVDLDLSTSTAVNAIKSVKINGISESGLTVKYDLYSDSEAKTLVTGNKNDTATLSDDGTVTAGKTPGTVYVKVYTELNNGRNIKGASKIVTVKVEGTAQAIISHPEKISLDLKNNKSVDLSKLFSVNDKNAKLTYTMTAAGTGENAGVATISNNSTLTAAVIGIGTLKVTSSATTDTRTATVTVPISVVDEIQAPAKVGTTITAPDYVRVTVGGTAVIGAKSTATGAAITYQSLDSAFATVDETTGIVTGHTSGIATVRVTSAETSEALAATKNVVVIVDPEPVTVVKPGVVKSLKVKNAKGAKVSVSWADQGGNIIYRVYKKVGSSKKWTSKDVVKANTTFSVKKGAKITVKVKAYVKDPVTGKVTWGPKATTAKAFKTDKK